MTLKIISPGRNLKIGVENPGRIAERWDGKRIAECTKTYCKRMAKRIAKGQICTTYATLMIN